jgi:hypothetical protein
MPARDAHAIAEANKELLTLHELIAPSPCANSYSACIAAGRSACEQHSLLARHRCRHRRHARAARG